MESQVSFNFHLSHLLKMFEHNREGLRELVHWGISVSTKGDIQLLIYYIDGATPWQLDDESCKSKLWCSRNVAYGYQGGQSQATAHWSCWQSGSPDVGLDLKTYSLPLYTGCISVADVTSALEQMADQTLMSPLDPGTDTMTYILSICNGLVKISEVCCSFRWLWSNSG